MTERERMLAVLNYEPYDRLPIVNFGYWVETLKLWADEGHITADEAENWWDGRPADRSIAAKLGFDLNFRTVIKLPNSLDPWFESDVIEELPDGSRKIFNHDGVIVLDRPDATGIPAEFDHLLKDRKSWEEHYLPRLQFSEERINRALVRIGDRLVRFDEGGREFLQKDDREFFYGLSTGSLFGRIRDLVGVTGATYIYAEDEPLFDEIIDVTADLCYRCAEAVLASGAKFDFAHYWEDVCFKSGPLISPCVFEEKVGPHYRRISGLLHQHGINIVSVDSDGMIDALIPTWLNNGVNTMFPIEVGTWNASIAPWRAEYGRELRGVGGMNKTVFSLDFAAVDAEIERLKPLVELGGYIPCPDHRIAPDAKWDNVRYYCDRMRQVFG